ncbi:MAG: DUF3343 domain-containing protein [Rikenellaceae bacterium]
MVKILFTFASSRAAIKADNLCKINNLKIKVIATPEDISSECGMSLEVSDSEVAEQLASLLIEKNIQYTKYDRSTSI